MQAVLDRGGVQARILSAEVVSRCVNRLEIRAKDSAAAAAAVVLIKKHVGDTQEGIIESKL